MANLTFIGGTVGGQGKTTVARTAAQHFVDYRNPDSFVFFDADRSNPGLHRTYGQDYECNYAIFSEGERFEDAANQVFNAALYKDVLVDLPAQADPALHEWIIKNGLFELAEENNVNFLMLFVSDGSSDSIRLFKFSLSRLGKIPHVFVKNYGLCPEDKWGPFDSDKDIKRLIKQHDVQVIGFPKLMGKSMIDRIDRDSLTFAKALECGELDLINKSRLRSFLKEAYAQLESTGYFPTEAG